MNIPASGGGAAAPTGRGSNATPGFVVSSGGKSGPSNFVFSTEDGTLVGWSGAVDPARAVNAVDNSFAGAVDKGLAQGFNATGSTSTPPTSKRQGYIDSFHTERQLLQRFASQGQHDSPWGIAWFLSQDRGEFDNALVVGNFGDGAVNAYDFKTGVFLGKFDAKSGAPIEIDGLWFVLLGNGCVGTNGNSIYFSNRPKTRRTASPAPWRPTPSRYRRRRGPS